jgi:hypothetical protein
MDRIENYQGSDGKLYAIEFKDSRFVMKRGDDIFTVGQQPSSPVPWEEWAMRQFAIEDVEGKILAERKG